MIYHPDLTVGPVRYPLSAFSAEGGQLSHELLFSDEWSAFPNLKDEK
jgi:hypothetical protein